MSATVSVRNPVVAGQFYPGLKNSLLEEVRGLLPEHCEKEDAKGILSPHAGYSYSGAVAAAVLSSIKTKGRYLILGPNHTGLGEAFGLSTDRVWKTPLGEVEVDQDLSEALIRKCPYIKRDGLSHSREHSIEVQLPFLQVVNPGFKFVPIVVSYQSLDIYREVGRCIAESILDLGVEKDTAIIASSDMTHYESSEDARKKDTVAIDAILSLDEKKLIDSVARLDISMCGYAPAAIMIFAAKKLGAKKAKLIKYQTSGDVTGDNSSVVGYAGIVIY